VAQDHPTIEAARLHSGTPHSVGLLWTSYRAVAGTSDNTQHSQDTDIRSPRWDSTPQSEETKGRRPTP